MDKINRSIIEYVSKFVLVVTLIVAISMLAGCYSFTGSSVPPHLKTITISLFDDQSGFGEPGLREKFTNRLINRFTQDNSLEVTDKSRADSMIEGIIQSVNDNPTVVQQGETVLKHRITVTVQTRFQDLKLKKKIWDRQVSNWAEFEISGGPARRQEAIDAAIEKLTEDIVLQTVSGW